MCLKIYHSLDYKHYISPAQGLGLDPKVLALASARLSLGCFAARTAWQSLTQSSSRGCHLKCEKNQESLELKICNILCLSQPCFPFNSLVIMSIKFFMIFVSHSTFKAIVLINQLFNFCPVSYLKGINL